MMSMLVIVTMLAIVATACGGTEENGTQPATTSTTAAATTAASPSAGGALDEEAAAGQKIAQAQCLTCHTTDGRPLVGPTWKGLYESTVELQDGTTVTADEDYLRTAITGPNAQIVKGFPAAMPSFSGVLSEDQVDALVAYIKALK